MVGIRFGKIGEVKEGRFDQLLGQFRVGPVDDFAKIDGKVPKDGNLKQWGLEIVQ